MNREETFAEVCGPFRHFDAPLYFQTGAETFTVSQQRGLYRLRFDERQGAIKSELLATFHARIIAREIDSIGRPVAVIAGRGASGRNFLFRCPARYLESGKASNAKRFLSCFYNFAGAAGFVMPGRLAATVRAILALSAEGEPIPRSADELAELDGET